MVDLSGIDIVPQSVFQIVVVDVAIVGHAEIGIVGRLFDDPTVVSAGVGDIPVADLALDGERAEIPRVVAIVWRKIMDLQITDSRIVEPLAIGPRLLSDERRREGPVACKIDLESRTATDDLGIVEVVLGIRRVVDGERRIFDGSVRQGVWTKIRPVSRRIVDVAAVALVKPNQTQCHGVAQWHIDEGLHDSAVAAGPEFVALQVIAGGKFRGIRLIRDNFQRTRERACSIEGALGTREGLDPIDVIKMKVRGGDTAGGI